MPRLLIAAAASVLSLSACQAQQAKTEATPAPAATVSVDARLVMVPVVVSDKKGLVTNLQRSDFAVTVDNRPQAIRYFDQGTDVPLTVGLVVDVGRSQTTVLDEEQKASQRFLESFLQPAAGKRAADKAFVLQFAHRAELLQDVTDSRPLLAAGLKEVGTQPPGAADEEPQASTNSNGNTGDPSSNGGGNRGGYGGYGRRGGYPGSGNGGPERPSGARGGSVLYDAVFLASGDVLGKHTGRRALVLLTDGVDRHSKESLTEAIEAAQRADVVIYAIYSKGREAYDFSDRRAYDRNGMPRMPGTGGSPGTDGTYANPDGKKILERLCEETGGRMFQTKGKGSLDDIYGEIGSELRSQYRIGFTPDAEAAKPGYHPLQLSLTNAANRKDELQTRSGFYAGSSEAH